MKRLTTIFALVLAAIFIVALCMTEKVEAKSDFEQSGGDAPFGEASGSGKKFEAEFYIKYTNRGCDDNGNTVGTAEAEVALRLRDKGSSTPQVFGANVPCGDVELFDTLLSNILDELEEDVCQALNMGTQCLANVNKVDVTADDPANPVRVLGTIGVVLKEQ